MARENVQTPDNPKKCDVCLFNNAALRGFQPTCEATCSQPMRVCMPCEKNSFLNPLTCFTCGSRFKRALGDDYGALLVAGSDEETEFTEAFKKDIESVKRVIISKAPVIMGIREKDVVQVSPDQGDMVQRIKMALEEFDNEHIKTLLIYFSCHGEHKKHTKEDTRKHFFLLGKETLSFDDFESELGKLKHIKTFVIVLDMCHARKVNIDGKNVLQINSCTEEQKSRAIVGGSTFTTFFIQGLRGASEKFNCSQKQSNTCNLCQQYFKKDDEFLSVERLFTYIKDHLKMRSFRGESDNICNPQTPKLFVATDTVRIAYNTDQPVRIEFHSETKQDEVEQQRKTVQINLEYFTDLIPVQRKLFEEYGRDKEKEKILIKAKKYRGDVPEVECDSLEKVMAAWINRDQLFVEFEPATADQ